MSRTKVRVPTRVTSKKKEARGIYPTAEVVPGRDWNATEENEGTAHALHYCCSIVNDLMHCR